MSDSEEDETPHEKVKKTLLNTSCRQSSKARLMANFKGVKSYLHQFYEYATDPNSCDDAGVGNVKCRRYRLRSLWWRIVLAVGVCLMALGFLAVFISYAVPRKPVIVEEEEEFAVMDKDAVEFNHNLEMLRLTGLATFCFGGLSSSIALLLASCCWNRYDSFERFGSEEIEPLKMAKKLVGQSGIEDEVPKSPTEMKVPGFESVLEVQPNMGASTSANSEESTYPLPSISTGVVID